MLELGAGLEPQFAGEQAATVTVDLQSIRLPAAAIQRDHQLGAEAFAQRVLGHEPVQLGDDLRVAAEAERGFGTVLDRVEAKILETADLCLREVVEGEFGQGRPSPEPKRLVEHGSRLHHGPVLESATAFGREPLEACGVHGAVVDPERVPGGTREEKAARPTGVAGRVERASQVGHVPLDGFPGRSRRVPTPQSLDDLVDRDDVAPVDQQQNQKRPLTTGRKPDFATVRIANVDRTEDVEIHVSALGERA